jgi:hypothetical protein
LMNSSIARSGMRPCRTGLDRCEAATLHRQDLNSNINLIAMIKY